MSKPDETEVPSPDPTTSVGDISLPGGAGGKSSEDPESGSEGPSAEGDKKKLDKVDAFFIAVKGATLTFKELLLGVKSPDWATRLASAISLILLVFTLMTCGAGVRYLLQQRALRQSEAMKNDPELQKARDLVEKRAQDEKRKKNTFVLGNFRTSLTSHGDASKRAMTLNLVELEVVIECDSLATRQYIEENIIPAQHQVATSFNDLRDSDLMTADGKRRLRRTIMYKLNTWLPKGKVEDLFFSHVVVL